VNLPNVLTLLRVVLTFLLMGLLFIPSLLAKCAVLVFFLLACLTDLLDGHIARRRNQISDFGKIMDPVADKILVIGIFLAFVQMQLVPAWMVFVIIIREFLITALRLFAIRRGKVLAAESIGKHKTVSQMVTIFFILLFLAVRESGVRFSFWNEEYQNIFKTWIFVLMSLTVVLTLYSGFSYLWQNKKLIQSL
jgi:CDP-diacylglycerol--glycerol-3-phosphate 3-phosphatidyltransferase